MRTHTLAVCAQVEASTTAAGDCLVYEQCGSADSLPWKVALAGGSAHEPLKPLAGFATRTLALAFAFSHRKDTGTVLDLGLVPAHRPRLLVVAEKGVTRVHSTHDVDAVVVNLQVRREFARSDLLPLHSDFGPMLEHLGIDWPVSPEGRRREPTATSALMAVHESAIAR